MRMSFWTVTVAVALCIGAQTLRADVWDLGGDNDNDFGSDNELVHGLDQVHDVAAQAGGTVEDVDWYSFRHACNATYEILLDGLTGEVSNGTTSPALELLASDTTTVIASAVPVSSLGAARRLTSECVEGTGVPPTEVIEYVRVSQPACHLACDLADQYHIRFRETTALVPRFNNSATQVSILVLQNSTPSVANLIVVSYDSIGAVIDYGTATLQPNQVRTFNLSTFGGGTLAGKSGALKIIGDAPYGAIAGKVVAVEPATGFTFDTPLVYKAY